VSGNHVVVYLHNDGGINNTETLTISGNSAAADGLYNDNNGTLPALKRGA
jgi:hypothetical protein